MAVAGPSIPCPVHDCGSAIVGNTRCQCQCVVDHRHNVSGTLQSLVGTYLGDHREPAPIRNVSNSSRQRVSSSRRNRRSDRSDTAIVDTEREPLHKGLLWHRNRPAADESEEIRLQVPVGTDNRSASAGVPRAHAYSPHQEERDNGRLVPRQGHSPRNLGRDFVLYDEPDEHFSAPGCCDYPEAFTSREDIAENSDEHKGSEKYEKIAPDSPLRSPRQISRREPSPDWDLPDAIGFFEPIESVVHRTRGLQIGEQSEAASRHS